MAKDLASSPLIGTLPVVALLAAWQLGSMSDGLPVGFLPSPVAVATRFLQLAGTPSFQASVAITAGRLAAGLAIALAVGISLGLAAASSRRGQMVVLPILRILAPIPKIALYPALMLVLGYANSSKIALVAIEAVFPILLATYQGARGVEPKLLWWALSAGTSPRMLPIRIVLPAALPSILVGVRISLIISCVVVFLAEMISSTDGLGHVLSMAARTFRTVDMFVPVVAISAIGMLSSSGLKWLRTKLVGGGADK